MRAITPILITAGCTIAASFVAEAGVSRQPQDEVAVTVDGDCDQEVWNRAFEFWETGSADEADWALRLLTNNLHSWNSHCKSVIKRLLEGLGRHRTPGGRAILTEYLRVDPGLEWAETISVTAATSLASFGDSAFDPLVAATSYPSERVASAAVLGLGELHDGRAVPVLESLTGSDSARIREYALVALGYYCRESSMRIASSALSSADADVRYGAARFVHWCAAESDIALMVTMLRDNSEAVRVEALQAVMAMKSMAACETLKAVKAQGSQFWMDLRREYLATCVPRQRE